MNKYGNRKVEVDGIRFDSLKEARRWQELRLLERAGEIHGLKRQVPFILIPSQRRNGKIVERPVKYIADFTYYGKDDELIVEDTKGLRTHEYIIKRKIMLWEFGLQIREV